MARRSRQRRDDMSHEIAVLILVVGSMIYTKSKHYLPLDWMYVWGIIAVVVLIVGGLAFRGIRIKRFKKAKMNTIDRMTGEQFEELLQYYLKRKGWRVKTTPTTGDFGADLVGTAPSGMKYVIQAKRWKSRVGIKGIQEVIGAKGYYHADAALLITNNYLTSSARELAKVNHVEVWERGRLEQELRSVQQRQSNTRVSASDANSKSPNTDARY